jgi:hypothetical protein
MKNATTFHGLEPFVLGRTKTQIEQLAGAPSATRSEDFENGDRDEVWLYEAEGVELAFSSADDWRLASITLQAKDIAFNGVFLIGAPASALPTLAAEAGAGDLTLTDDLGDSGICHVSDACGLMLWVLNEVVVNATLFPAYDERGSTPIWPDTAAL